MAKVFISCATYALGKSLGIEAAAREFARQCERPSSRDLPAARFVGRMRTLADCAVFHGAGTLLPKLRSRAAHEAWESGADHWLMIDDDIECDQRTCARLMVVAGSPRNERIVCLPYRMRGAGAEQTTLSCQFESEITRLIDGVPVRPILRGGTGAMLVTRGALDKLVRAHVNDDWLDDDGERKAALFEMIRTPGGPWWGEDFSFCARARAAGVELLAIVEGVTNHDGQMLILDNAM